MRICTCICCCAIECQKVGPKEVPVGQNADYQITVINTGDKTLHEVIVTDIAPSATSIVAAPGANINWQTSCMEAERTETRRKSDIQHHFDNLHSWLLCQQSQRDQLRSLQFLLRVWNTMERTSCIWIFAWKALKIQFASAKQHDSRSLSQTKVKNMIQT